MPLIGILTNKKNENGFRKILIKKTQKEQKKFDIIFINDNSIDNIKNIKFETILIDKKEINQYEDRLKIFIKSAKYLIINSDLINDINILNNMELSVITYGFNSKATITASSIEDENNMLSLQRSIKTIYNKIVEQQEIILNFATDNKYIDMGITAIMLIYNLE